MRLEFPQKSLDPVTQTAIASPYLSLVVTSRNDDHGKDLLKRMQMFVTGLLEQCRRFALPAELIIVEWNPPGERPSLAASLSWPVHDGPCAVRIITVPPERHRRFQHADALPLFQMIGKNVGIRRARGQFILSTNIDLLFSDDLVRFFVAKRLQHGVMYRTDRYDVSAGVLAEASIRDQLAYCESHLIRINASYGTLEATGAERRFYPPDFLEQVIHRLPRWVLRRSSDFLDWLFEYTEKRGQARARGPNPPKPGQQQALYKRIIKALALYGYGVVSRPHTNACGDFTLLSREDWFRLRGYPEFEMFSMHLDGVPCAAAWWGGIPQRVLRRGLRVYHIEHGSGYTPEGWRAVVERLQARGIPMLEYSDVRRLFAKIRANPEICVFNGPNWGLDGEELPECVIAGS